MADESNSNPNDLIPNLEQLSLNPDEPIPSTSTGITGQNRKPPKKKADQEEADAKKARELQLIILREDYPECSDEALMQLFPELGQAFNIAKPREAEFEEFTPEKNIEQTLAFNELVLKQLMSSPPVDHLLDNLTLEQQLFVRLLEPLNSIQAMLLQHSSQLFQATVWPNKWIFVISTMRKMFERYSALFVTKARLYHLIQEQYWCFDNITSLIRWWLPHIRHLIAEFEPNLLSGFLVLLVLQNSPLLSKLQISINPDNLVNHFSQLVSLIQKADPQRTFLNRIMHLILPIDRTPLEGMSCMLHWMNWTYLTRLELPNLFSYISPNWKGSRAGGLQVNPVLPNLTCLQVMYRRSLLDAASRFLYANHNCSKLTGLKVLWVVRPDDADVTAFLTQFLAKLCSVSTLSLSVDWSLPNEEEQATVVYELLTFPEDQWPSCIANLVELELSIWRIASMHFEILSTNLTRSNSLQRLIWQNSWGDRRSNVIPLMITPQHIDHLVLNITCLAGCPVPMKFRHNNQTSALHYVLSKEEQNYQKLTVRQLTIIGRANVTTFTQFLDLAAQSFEGLQSIQIAPLERWQNASQVLDSKLTWFVQQYPNLSCVVLANSRLLSQLCLPQLLKEMAIRSLRFPVHFYVRATEPIRLKWTESFHFY